MVTNLLLSDTAFSRLTFLIDSQMILTCSGIIVFWMPQLKKAQLDIRINAEPSGNMIDMRESSMTLTV